MPSFFNNRLIIMLVSLIAVVAIVGMTMKDRPNPTWPEQFVRDSTGFMQSLFYKPARAVAGFIENLLEIKVLYTENQRLKANLYETALLTARIRDLESQVNSLSEMLALEKNLNEYTLRGAEVIMRSPERWHQQITINRGQKHGIKPNMAVISAKGLVGRVKSVAQFTAVVELLNDTNRSNFISAVVVDNTSIYGLIEGYDIEKEALYFRRIPIDANISEGQQVISSGLGGVFPRGLYIGEVIEVLPDQYGLTKSALIKPAANLYQLDFLFVVERAFLPALDITAPEEPALTAPGPNIEVIEEQEEGDV